ncbi:hypothetical protein FQA47_005234 [Oryzias melastigma]|uniref:Uncharacterized protein n=1 Tax=Oryzias melastigma TaxID=30732 RepID=A0A834CHS0_ORYME|nr:hypothetical protein FQA47_005234 [Oryzias melastigma]
MKLSSKMMFLWRQKTVKSNEANLQVLLKDERRTCLGLMTPERTTEGKNQSLTLENNLKGHISDHVTEEKGREVRERIMRRSRTALSGHVSGHAQAACWTA